MFTRSSFIIIFLITTVNSQSVQVQFPTFPSNTDYGPCTCDLTASKCDSSCCCDSDCTSGDLQAFQCSTRSNQYTNATPVLSTIQSTCYKDTSIFKLDTPYVLQKMGELVCVDFSRYTGSQYYQQPTTSSLNAGLFIKTLDAKYSVSAPESLTTGSTNYQVGSSVLAFFSTRSLTTFFSLPVKLFNNPLCSGSQTITYMKDFTSTCLRSVTTTSCTGSLNAATYLNSLCLIQSPSKLSDTNATVCINNSTFSTSNVDSTNATCINALQSLNIRVFYSNPTGIIGVNVTTTPTNPAIGSTMEQTFTVTFTQTNLASGAANATRSPGYRQGDAIQIGTPNGTIINTLSSSQFSIIKPASTGSCSSSTGTQIRFGENLRSTCKINWTPTTTTCPVSGTNFLSFTFANLYVAAYRNSETTNINSDWLPVISCTSLVGSLVPPTCQKGILLSDSLTADRCYIKLNIEIAYTKVGSVYNPQPVLSAVIFYYQYVAASQLPSSFFVTQSVTFQNLSSSPALEYGEIPVPDVRLPADFFYPFSGSYAPKLMTNPLFSYLLISMLLILM